MSNFFYLEPYTYFEENRHHILFYNTLTGNEHIVKKNHVVNSIMDEIKKDKIFSVKVDKDILENKEFVKFKEKLRNIFIGDLVKSENRPIIFNQNAYYATYVSFLQNLKTEKALNYAKSFISEVSFFLNSETSCKTLLSLNSYKQFLSPHYSKLKTELPHDTINSFVSELVDFELKKINILGGNFFNYSKIIYLIENLNKYDIEKIYFINYLDLYYHIDELATVNFDSNSKLNIMVNLPLDVEKLDQIISHFQNQNINARFTFLLEDEKSYKKIEKYVYSKNLCCYTYKPYFNNRNIRFFENNVYLTSDDILEQKQSMKKIYGKALTNTLNFGHLYVKNDGRIHSDLNEPAIGKLSSYTFEDLVLNALKDDNSWLHTRKELNPCKNCLFRLLCPPISGYEKVLGINNLCKL